MKTIYFHIVVLTFHILCIAQFNITNSQILQNYGTVVSAKSGSVITVNGSVLNQTGTINISESTGVPATIYVSQDITNNGEIFGDGHIHLLGNWIDNGSFSSSHGTVFMDGGTQILGGTSATIFHNLTLDGSGFKIQQVNKSATGVLSLNHLELKTETFAFYMDNPAPEAITLTTGFVSSLDGGYLGRRTNSNQLYLYPVGSSVGVTRYRPVEIRPVNSTPNQYTVRFANLDATLEGYDRSLHDDSICQANALFYHQINRTIGATNADVTVNYNPTTDGLWSRLSKWESNSSAWENIPGSFTASGSPFFKAQKLNWGDFTDLPYILSNTSIDPSFDPVPAVCYGDLISPLPTTSTNGFSGTWSPAINNTDTTTYTFTPGIDQCSFPTTMTIIVYPQALVTITDTSICTGGTATLVATGTPAGGSYFWSNTNPTSTIIVSPNFTTTYNVFYTSLNNCFATASRILAVNPIPIASFESSLTIFSEPNQIVAFTNTSSGATSYSWNFGDGTYSSEVNPAHIFTDNTNGQVITLTAYSPSLCADVSSIEILYNEGIIYYIPNTFTPNGDEFNQTFQPIFTSSYDPHNFEMLIFDRWGEIVFETHDVTKGWNGTFANSNSICQDGIYTYKILVKSSLSAERKEVWGNVSLIK